MAALGNISTEVPALVLWYSLQLYPPGGGGPTPTPTVGQIFPYVTPATSP